MAVTTGQNDLPGTDLSGDPRWQLVQRIASSLAFQKSARLRDLLLFITERRLHGTTHELTEQYIGHAVFGKPADYAPVEDSSVRVHVRQLRLKLHEYFNGEGRSETLVIEIPKGSYVPVFHDVPASAASAAEAVPQAGPRVRGSVRTLLPWALCVILTATCAVLFVSLRSAQTRQASPAAPWPLSAVLNPTSRTEIVLADSNYGMLRIIGRKSGSLEQYLKPDFFDRFRPLRASDHESRIMDYIADSLLTSYADAAIVASLINLAGPARANTTVRSARELRLRDLEEGNYVFVGSPGSNPWVSLFESRLNFQETEGVVGEDTKFFRNKQPRDGEKPAYQGLRWTGTSGEDYATLALLPNERRTGSILIFQGLQQEGTEAAGLFLADESNRRKLKEALGGEGVRWFEILLRTQAVAGAPNATTIVASRTIR
jgi:hypothetical protein